MLRKSHNVLALDLAARTGWAVGRSNAAPVFGAVRVGMEDDSRSFVALERLIVDLAEKHGVDALASEAPFFAQTNSTFATVERLHGYKAIMLLVAGRLRLPFALAPVASIRKTFIGRSPKGEGKAAVIAECQRIGLDVTDHNVADAIAVWYWAHRVQWPSCDAIRIDPQRDMLAVP